MVVYGHVDYLRRPKRASLHVCGRKGTIEWSYYEKSLKWVGSGIDAEADISYHSEDRNQLFVDSALDFLSSAERHSSPRSTLVDGINALAIVDSIQKSIVANSPIGIKNFF